MRGKILTWDEFREYCKEDAYHWHESGYSIADVTVEDILSEYSDDYFTDSTDDDYDELSSCFTAKEFASKTLEYLREIENDDIFYKQLYDAEYRKTLTVQGGMERFLKLVKEFDKNKSIEMSLIVDIAAQVLHDKYKLDYGTIETLEIEAYNS